MVLIDCFLIESPVGGPQIDCGSEFANAVYSDLAWNDTRAHL